MTTEDLMRLHGIERVVFVPKSELLPRDTFHAWPSDTWLAEHCGTGATIEAAIHDAVARRQQRAA